MSRLLFLSAFTFLVACAGTTSEMFPRWSDLDEFERDWYSKHLMAARESALTEASRKTIVRLTWLRSFHNPVVVRVECGASCQLTSVRLSGAGGYEPGTIAESHRERLSRAQKGQLMRLVSEMLNHRDVPVDEKTYEVVDGQLVEEIIVHTDGAQWIVEIVDANDYVASAKHGAELRKNDAMASLCEYLVSISKIEIPEGEYY